MPAPKGSKNAANLEVLAWLAAHNITYTQSTRIRLEYALNQAETVDAVKQFVKQHGRNPADNAELRKYARQFIKFELPENKD